MAERSRAAFIGAFVIGAIAIVVVTIVALGSGRFFRTRRQYVMYFSGSVNGLSQGAPVKISGVPVGEVKRILLGFNPRGELVEEIPSHVKIAVIVELDEQMLRSRGVRNVNLADPEHMARAVSHGLRGVLAMESFVTGILYVDLEMLPDSSANFVVGKNDEYVEIPTVPTALEQAQVVVTDILEHLRRADLDRVMNEASQSLAAIRNLVTSPQLQASVDNLAKASEQLATAAASVKRLADNLNTNAAPLAADLRRAADAATKALGQTQRTLAGMQETFDRNSPFAYQLNQVLAEIADTSRSLRELADYLQRNPSSVVRGKPAPPEAK
jgi:paraquat-inducible protein B